MRNFLFSVLVTIFSVLTAPKVFSQVVDTVCVGTEGEIYKVIPTPGSDYFWEVEGGAIAFPSNSCQVTVNWGLTPGLFKIKVLERSSLGCPGDTVIAYVWVRDDIKVQITGPREICAGEGVLLTASGASTYKWSDGTTGPDFFFRPTKDTSVFVTGTESGCKPDTSSYFLRVHPTPVADFSIHPEKPIAGKNAIFKYTGSGASTYQWFVEGNGPMGTAPRLEHLFPSGGVKAVQLVVNNEIGCRDTMLKNILVDEDVNIYIPNAFTPNKDGRNEFFNAVCTGVKELNIEIFNRWGEKIHTITDQDSGWDGSYLGQPVQEGVYLYIVSAKGVNNRFYNLKGTLTLIR